MKPVWILLFGIFLVSPPVESKSKKRKRRAAPPTEQVETKEDKLLSKEKKEIDLASRCMAYCDFTTQCLDKICASNPTVSMQTCFNQCVEAKTLSPDELNNTLKEGCFRTQLIFCQTGLLKDKCECPTGPQAQCSQGQHCNLPLTEGRWACGTPAADLPANRPPL